MSSIPPFNAVPGSSFVKTMVQIDLRETFATTVLNSTRRHIIHYYKYLCEFRCLGNDDGRDSCEKIYHFLGYLI